jgi:protein SCO1/2
MGSFHCAAMCGGFSVGLMRSPAHAKERLALYHLGKISTYIFLGAVAGLLGAALLANGALRWAQFVFSSLAGVLIAVVGLQTLGLLPGQSIVNSLASRLWLGPFLSPFFKTFRTNFSRESAFFLGLFNGFLPCGLVYTFALTAAATASLPSAVFVMLAFGLGTVPILLAVAWGANWLQLQSQLRPWLARSSGILIVILGFITVWRGLPALPVAAASTNALSPSALHAGHGNAQPSIVSVALPPVPAPDFNLRDQANQNFSLSAQRGKVVMLDFIYTTCTSTCPLLSATFRDVQNSLGAELGTKVTLLSITIDPATDTPPVLQAYGERWNANFAGWKFLTGDEADIRTVTNDYAIYFEQTATGFAHTESIMLIDARGQLRTAFGLQADPRQIVEKIKSLLRE